MGEGVTVAVTMMVSCRVAAQRQGVARSHGRGLACEVVAVAAMNGGSEGCQVLSRHRGGSVRWCLGRIALYDANATSATSRHLESVDQGGIDNEQRSFCTDSLLPLSPGAVHEFLSFVLKLLIMSGHLRQ